jgi:hypothetical protein
LQGSLASAEDSILKGFDTIFTTSPWLHREALDMPRSDLAVVVPAWSLPTVNRDDCEGGDESCAADNGGGELDPRSKFYFDTSPSFENDASSRKLTVCIANEHMPHPVEQLQPCIDAGATAVLSLRLPLLAIDAVSLSKGVEEGISGAFIASEQDLVQGDGHCMAAAVKAHKNGAYM